MSTLNRRIKKIPGLILLILLGVILAVIAALMCIGKVIKWAAAGQPIHMVGCHIDISERKRTKVSLQQAMVTEKLLKPRRTEKACSSTTIPSILATVMI